MSWSMQLNLELWKKIRLVLRTVVVKSCKISQDRNVFLVLSPNARLFDIGDGRFVPERVSWSSENYFTISSTSGTGYEDDPQMYHEQGYRYNKKDGIAYQDYESSVESISGKVVSETDYPELPPGIMK